MPPVPILTPREVVKTFQRLGWRIARQRGSHIILIKEGYIATLSATIPKSHGALSEALFHAQG